MASTPTTNERIILLVIIFLLLSILIGSAVYAYKHPCDDYERR